jgi:hypothetical protein
MVGIFIGKSKKEKEKLTELSGVLKDFSPLQRKQFVAKAFQRQQELRKNTIGGAATGENLVSKVLRGQGFSIDELTRGKAFARKATKRGVKI